MNAADNLHRGRDAFLRQRWTDAYGLLTTANRDEPPLEPTDLERLATAAYLLGKDAEVTEIWTRAHQELLERGAVARAARCAFSLASGLMHQGERARAGGWITRARELLDNARDDGVERGYLLFPVALQPISKQHSAMPASVQSRTERNDTVRCGAHCMLGRKSASN